MRSLNRINVGSFHSLLSNEIVGAGVSILSKFDDLLVGKRLGVDSNYVACLKQLVEIIVYSGARYVKALVEFQISVYGGRREGEIVLREKIEEDLLFLALTHIRLVGGCVCISSEPASIHTIRPILGFLDHVCTNKGKLLSSWPLYTRTHHELGVIQRLLVSEKRVDACCQQTPSSWQNRMYEHELRRVKRPGLNAAQTPSKAPAPLPLPQVHGASAGVTTANHTRTASARSVSAGGGRHVPV